jgi:flagellar biosynthesis/type III secretory pathway protein FliH
VEQYTCVPCTNYGEQLAYQEGYHRGYTEGFNKAIETLEKEFELARLSRPVVIEVNKPIIEIDE